MVCPRRAKSVSSFEANASCLFRGDRKIGHRLVQDYALDRIKLSLPRRLLECLDRGLVTCLSAQADSRWSEIDIFSVVLVFETRRQKAHDVHLRHAAIAREFAYLLTLAYVIRNMPNQLADDVAQPMRLLLPGDVARNAARVLYILLTVQNLPD